MRITNYIRDKIKQALIEHAFAEREKAMAAREDAIALRVYRLRMPEEFERQLDEANAVGITLNFYSPFVDSIDSVDARAKGMSVERLKFLHRRVWNDRYTPRIDVMDHDEVAPDFEKFVADRNALNTEIGLARAEIRATLAPIYTAKALRAAWPEVMSIAEPILIEQGMQPKPQAIVVATENLNVKLGLPADVEVEQKEAA